MKTLILLLFVVGMLFVGGSVRAENLFIDSETTKVASAEAGSTTNSGIIDQSDFFSDFAHSFGLLTGDDNYNTRFDFDNDGDVDGKEVLPLLNGDLPAAGNPDGQCTIPFDAMEADIALPDHVIGDGSVASCTSQAVVAAIAQGGIITFDCGPDPVTIVLQQTAKIYNVTGPEIVIDGGGAVTLSGDNQRRILYMNTCDQDQGWTTDHCQNQDHPRLTVQNLTFIDGNSTAEAVFEGGGAIWVRGGRFKVIDSNRRHWDKGQHRRFMGNTSGHQHAQ